MSAHIMAWISFVAVVDVVWLHAATYGADMAAFGRVERVVWGLAVPWFFLSSMFWLAVKWRGFKVEMGRRVRSLLAPYFCWCVLGSLWSIALHGVRFQGWELLRYLGLHPWLDPAYQPMWFIRNLFLVLLAEAAVLHILNKRFKPLAVSLNPRPQPVLSLVFPIYVFHSMWLSVARLVLGKQRFEGMEALVVGVIALSIGCKQFLRRYCPKGSALLWGYR